VLLVGCGDVAARLKPLLPKTWTCYGLLRDPARRARWRTLGVHPIAGDLDQPGTLLRLRGLAQIVIHLAPPPATGPGDPRTANLLAALGKGSILPACLVYISTSGVYGDCGGDWVAETRPRRAESARAARRVDAEDRLRAFARRNRVRLVVLRVPGIYASNRLPLARLTAGTPALVTAEDPFTNHIHADDLARIIVSAIFRGTPLRAYHAADGAALRMGDYFDQIARHFRLPCPPRIDLAEAQRTLPPTLLSFMRESRRLDNQRLRTELGVRLTWPSVADFLASQPAP
jgi:nucleoside-diphosphate-sugar epimerase